MPRHVDVSDAVGTDDREATALRRGAEARLQLPTLATDLGESGSDHDQPTHADVRRLFGQ